MILKDVFRQADFQGVFEVLLGYSDVTEEKRLKIKQGFHEVQNMEEKACEEMFTVGVYKFKDDDGEVCFDVSGTCDKDEDVYSLVFTPCEEWISFEVSKETIEKLEVNEIAAHCFWEMTYAYGWTGEDRKRNIEEMEYMNSIKEKIEKIEERIDEELFNDIIKFYNESESSKIRWDIELEVEELLEKNLVSDSQKSIIKVTFNDEDILNLLGM